MKRHVVLCWFAVCLPLAAALPHWDLEMTSAEYTALLKNVPRDRDRALSVILDTGKRSFDWLQFINAHRPEGKKISFSSPDTQLGYPIATPNFSSPAIIEELYATFFKEAPAWFSEVVLKSGAFPENPGDTDEEYIKWGLRLDRIYQRASRWLLQEPYLGQYASYRKNDVRGYYHLNQYADVKATLDGYSGLGAEEQQKIAEWMAGMCSNGSASLASCRTELKNLVTAGKPLYPYYQKYLSGGKRMWDGYFLLGGKRKDVTWDSAFIETMTVPFVDPKSSEVERFLTDNIQAEWHLDRWQLQLAFQSSTAGTAHIVFEAGATPHVNGLGGNTITMDKNQPLTEYNVQWTIRHEFGHVLGYPDCYVEFYDSDQKVMINYQLDITNLMCSRRGHIQDIHYQEAKKAYGKKSWFP